MFLIGLGVKSGYSASDKIMINLSLLEVTRQKCVIKINEFQERQRKIRMACLACETKWWTCYW